MKKRTYEQLRELAYKLSDRYGKEYKVCDYCNCIYIADEGIDYDYLNHFCSQYCLDIVVSNTKETRERRIEEQWGRW
jgi:hypothetical protein